MFKKKFKIYLISLLLFLSTTFLYCQNSKDSPFGVNFWEDELSNSGIKWTRINITWAEVEKEKGKFNFENADKYIDKLYNSNLKILAVLIRPPSWASRIPKNYKPIEIGAHKGWGDFPPNDLDAWGRYIFETVSHFKTKIKHWEIWNEPNMELFFNGGTVDDYVALLKVAYLNAKKADPDCKIVGLGGTDAIYAKMVMERGGFDFMDTASIHIYHFLGHIPERESFIPGIIETQKVLSGYGGGKDMWITETGWPTHQGMTDGWIGVSLDEQAKYLVRSIVLSLPEGVKKIFWFAARNGGEDITNFEHNQGLLYHNKTPKPSLFAYTTLIKMIGEFSSVEKINISPFYIYLFKKEKNYCFILWTISKKVKMKVKDEIANIFDINGTRINITDFYLPVSPSPIYILTENPDKIKHILRNAEIILR